MGWEINGDPVLLVKNQGQASLSIGGADSASFFVRDDPGLARDDAIEVKWDSKLFFTGYVRSVTRTKSQGILGYRIQCESGLARLFRAPLTMDWSTGSGDVPKTVSRCYFDGTETSTTAFLTGVVAAQAAAVAGVTLAVSLTGTFFPPFELVDVTIGEALIQLLKFHPEAVIFWDYATSPPTLRVKGRGALSTVTRDVEYEGAQSQLVEYSEGSDEDVRGIVLSYEVETVTDGEIFREYVEDSAGVTTGLNVVRQTIPWRGKSSSRTLQTQPIKTEDIPGPSGTNIKNWIKKHIPELSGADNGNLTVESVDASEFIDWDDDDGAQPSEASRMLVYGHKTDWMASSFWECAVNVKVEITWGGGPGDAGADAFPPGQKTRTFVVRVTGTNMTSRTYTALDSVEETGPDPIPTGLASHLWSNRPTAVPSGTVRWNFLEVDEALTAGKKLTLTGGVSISGGTIQTVQRRADGETTVTFGAAGTMPRADLFLDLLRANSRSKPQRRYRSNTVSTGAGTDREPLPGSKSRPTSAVVTPTPAPLLMAFAPRWDGANVRIEGGWVMATEWGASLDTTRPTPAAFLRAFSWGGGTIALTNGQTAWLKITLVQREVEFEGPLAGMEPQDFGQAMGGKGGEGGYGGQGGYGGMGGDGGNGGGGGTGGGGGGGGGGNDTFLAQDGTNGTDGLDGIDPFVTTAHPDPGIGGDGGLIGYGPSTAYGGGNGGNGGYGGSGGAGEPGVDGENGVDGNKGADGADGADGDPIVFDLPTKARVKRRYYEPGSFSLEAHSSAPDSSDSVVFWPLVKRAGSALKAEQVGAIALALPFTDEIVGDPEP